MLSVTVENLVKVMNLDTETASQIADLVSGLKDPESIKETEEWISQCYHKPNENELIMHACDVLMNTCGVESIEIEGAYVSRYYQSSVASYCNTGETYSTTLVFDHENQEFGLSSYGDFFEGWEMENQE
jgi:hypothetical protein